MYLYCTVCMSMSSYDPDFLIISSASWMWKKCEEKSKYLVVSINEQNHNFQLSRAEPDMFYWIFVVRGISFAFCAISDPAKVEYSEICRDSNPWLLIKQDVALYLSEDVPETEGYEAPPGMNLNEQSQYAVVTVFPSPSLLTHAQKCRETKPTQEIVFSLF